MKYSEINGNIKYFITDIASNNFVAVTEDLPNSESIKGYIYNINNKFINPIVWNKKDLKKQLLQHPNYFKLAKYRATAVKGLRYE